MKLTLPRQPFQDALAAACSVISTRTPKEIFRCVRLLATEGGLRLSATDGETALQTTVEPVEARGSGQAVVAADRLLGIIRELADVEVVLEAAEQFCTIRAEGSEFKVFVADPADFPPVPDFTGEPDVALDGRRLRRAVALTLYAAARETSRYAINGVLWEKRDQVVHLVATDGRRLARAACPVLGGPAKEFNVIVPAKALSVFERVFLPQEGAEPWPVDVKVTPNQLLLRSGSTVLATALVEGHFPSYQDVIPKDATRTLRVDRELLHGAVRRAALLTTEDSRTVRLACVKDGLTISSRAPEQGEATIRVPAEFDGEPIEIGFNPTYLSDPLRVLDFEQVIIKLSGNTRPGVLRGEDPADFLYVVMPVSLT